jgi:hypothetical protein
MSKNKEEAEFRFLNLNSTSEEELANLPMIGPERAKALCLARPFRGWSDVEKVPGIGKGVVDDLRSGGAQLRNRYSRKQGNKTETGSATLGARVGGCDPTLFEAPASSQVGPMPTDDPERGKS